MFTLNFGKSSLLSLQVWMHWPAAFVVGRLAISLSKQLYIVPNEVTSENTFPKLDFCGKFLSYLERLTWHQAPCSQFHFELIVEGIINGRKNTPVDGTLIENKQAGQIKQKRSSSQSRLFPVSSFAPDKCLSS